VELLKASTTANPISDKYIQDKKEEKKAGKVISSLVRNAKPKVNFVKKIPGTRKRPRMNYCKLLPSD
jgi:hypothetical protein